MFLNELPLPLLSLTMFLLGKIANLKNIKFELMQNK